jgi:hypothetical protein
MSQFYEEKKFFFQAKRQLHANRTMILYTTVTLYSVFFILCDEQKKHIIKELKTVTECIEE